jgi:rhodanese-related sulfurtransferase
LDFIINALIVILMKLLAALVLTALAFFLGYFFNQAAVCSALGNSGLQTVSPVQFSRRLSACHPVILDVRTSAEFSSGHLTGATNADFNQSAQFSLYLDSLNKSASYFIYCRTGKRSAQAMQLMADKGFTNVTNLDGGITAWSAAGLLVAK